MTARPQTTPCPGGPLLSPAGRSALSLGYEVRNLVLSAVRMRRKLIAIGASRLTAKQLHAPTERLAGWCHSHRPPGLESLKAFRAGQLFQDLRDVIPHTKGGMTLLSKIDALTNL